MADDKFPYKRLTSPQPAAISAPSLTQFQFINPRRNGVLDWEQQKLYTLKVEVIYAVEG